MAMAFVGPIPPAYGAPRHEFLMQRARAAAGQASRGYMAAVEEVERVLGPITLPPRPSPTDLVGTQLGRWERIRAALVGGAMGTGELPGERLARFALARAVEANYDWSESEMALTAHQWMHRLGELVGGLYCCHMEWDADRGLWFDRCAVSLSHSGLGVSPGFTADLVCSICRGDIADCKHISDCTYSVHAERTEAGFCTVCDHAGCSHKEGVVYEVHPRSVFTNIEFQEGTLTPRPREPRARVTGIETDPQPRAPRSQSSRRRCLKCLLPCPGLPVDTSWSDEIAEET